MYIAPNFQGLQFSWIGVLKNFAETISQIKDSVSINKVFKNFAELKFRGSMPIRKKRKNNAPRKFGAVWY